MKKSTHKTPAKHSKPVLLITGASGGIGTKLCRAFSPDYTVVGLDVKPCHQADISYEIDLTSPQTLKNAFDTIKSEHGKTIAGVIHLAAFFDFTGEPNPLYQSVNVDGTKHLLDALSDFTVDRFIYASTMLVHDAGVPGEKIDETAPINPGWAYPKSKAKAEDIITNHPAHIPYTILRLAGVYNDEKAVPTLSQQIARIYERDIKSHLYAGDIMAGQAFLHEQDMIDLFVHVMENRHELPTHNVFLAGEENVMNYQELQNRIGALIFGEKQWDTYVLPEMIAKAGAIMEDKLEPIIPDAIDKGEKPFIKPFMIDLASDHYDVDITAAKHTLGWHPRHDVYHGLEALISSLKQDPAAWYKRHAITPPDFVASADETQQNPHDIREKHEAFYRHAHRQHIWAPFLTMGLSLWLLSAPFILGYESQAMIISNMISGVALAISASLSLSPKYRIMRWVSGFVGLWLLAAPLIFWAPTAAAYLNDTLVGMIVMALALCVRPTPGIAPVAEQTGPTIPPGWEFSPSNWFQRMPIIILAFIGFFISRYLCAYQLGHIDTVWDPFFTGSLNDPQNGTEEIITSYVSEAWPVPDAGLGAMTYALEILTGIMGSAKRWRTMPWLVMLFGVMIVPLGAISIFFIIIQPILLGTWCTLCLIAAAAMLLQIPYSLDELVATSEFLYRRVKKGRPLLRIFFMGDTDEGHDTWQGDNFERRPLIIMKDMVTGGVSYPWTLLACIPIGVWLMFTRLTMGAEGGMANADHLIGALVVTIAVTAMAESGRACRFLLIPLGAALLITPFVYGAGITAVITSLLCGALIIGLAIPRGHIHNNYGLWNKAIF